RWREEVEEHALLERGRARSIEQLEVLELELAPWRELEEESRSAVAGAERVEDLEQALPGVREGSASTAEELTELESQRSAAEELAQQAEAHVPRVRAAQDRLLALRAELPQREPLLAATDQE